MGIHYRWGGKPLRVGGKLARGYLCCCDITQVDCPVCVNSIAPVEFLVDIFGFTSAICSGFSTVNCTVFNGSFVVPFLDYPTLNRCRWQLGPGGGVAGQTVEVLLSYNPTPSQSTIQISHTVRLSPTNGCTVLYSSGFISGKLDCMNWTELSVGNKTGHCIGQTGTCLLTSL